MKTNYTKDELTSEYKYHQAIKVAKMLLDRGTIGKREYNQIDTIMTDKYKPILGSIKVDNMGI